MASFFDQEPAFQSSSGRWRTAYSNDAVAVARRNGLSNARRAAPVDLPDQLHTHVPHHFSPHACRISKVASCLITP